MLDYVTNREKKQDLRVFRGFKRTGERLLRDDVREDEAADDAECLEAGAKSEFSK